MDRKKEDFLERKIFCSDLLIIMVIKILNLYHVEQKGRFQESSLPSNLPLFQLSMILPDSNSFVLLLTTVYPNDSA